MTIVELILSLRPADGSVASTLAAIGRARVALTDADEAMVAAQQEHDASLLDTDPTRFPDAMKKLGKIKLETAEIREKVSAMLAQLEARLPVAKRVELQAQLEAKRQDVEATGVVLADLWGKSRAKLALLLRELEEADTEYVNARFELSTAVTKVFPIDPMSQPQPDPELKRPHAAPTGSSADGWRGQVAEMAQPVRKPIVRAPDPEGDARREEREGKIRAGLADYARREPHGSASHSATRAWPN